MGHALFAAVTTAYILIAIQLEERDLITMLGEVYASYSNRVPALIPFTKSGRGTKKSSGDAPSVSE
jgi:protein-S-isoprenylcysteine O-methyltransferase Ste14